MLKLPIIRVNGENYAVGPHNFTRSRLPRVEQKVRVSEGASLHGRLRLQYAVLGPRT